mmetsp:Transcript_72147/g.150651  ORF Transcript_72147/g.150651 Transcript_72147/m.150651 type:complete len:295 (+) Transcript_72147:74-958(+)
MSTTLLVEEAESSGGCFRSLSSSSVRSRLDSLDVEDADLLLSQWGQRLLDEALLAKERAEGLSALSLPPAHLASPSGRHILRDDETDSKPFRACVAEESPSRDDRRSCTSLFQLQTAAEVLGLWRPSRPPQASKAQSHHKGCCHTATAADDDDDEHCFMSSKSRTRSAPSDSRPKGDSKPIKGTLTLRGVLEDSSWPLSLASALPQAFRTLLKPCGGVTVKMERAGPSESLPNEHVTFEFEIIVDDDNDRPIAKEILTIEGALGGAKQLLPSLAEASVGDLGRLSLRLELTSCS